MEKWHFFKVVQITSVDTIRKLSTCDEHFCWILSRLCKVFFCLFKATCQLLMSKESSGLVAWKKKLGSFSGRKCVPPGCCSLLLLPAAPTSLSYQFCSLESDIEKRFFLSHSKTVLFWLNSFFILYAQYVYLFFFQVSQSVYYLSIRITQDISTRHISGKVTKLSNGLS